MTNKFADTYRHAMQNPEEFWEQAAQDIDWFKKPTQIINHAAKPHESQWFADGLCNTCYNAIDRHVKDGNGNRIAIIHDSPMTKTQNTLTYGECLDKIAKFAGGLQSLGLNKGDRAIIYMPMIPEAVIAMLACARIGVIHSVVFGGFAAAELAVRIKDATPKAIITTTCGLEPGRTIAYMPLINEAIKIAEADTAHKVKHTVIYQRPEQAYELAHPRDTDWQNLQTQSPAVDCVPLESGHPLYILYTSGTTGQPKGVVRDNGGHMVALKWSMKNIYDIAPGEIYWAASDVGWVVGHSYIVYAPLLHGCTSVIYEGKPVGTPDAGVFWRVIAEHKVAALFTAPTALRAVKKEDPDGKFIPKYDLSGMRSLFLAGERCDPDTLEWAQNHLNIPVIDHWWQTETGWSIAANCLGLEKLPIKAGSPTFAVPGYEVKILKPDGDEAARGDMGAICVKLPLPPGCFPTLWNAHERYENSYFKNYPGYYETGDAGYIDEDGYIFVMARTDDIINVAGHRLSTGAMEEVLSTHPQVAECAVFGAADALKGELPIGLVVLKAGSEASDVAQEAIELVRSVIGPVAAFKSCAVVKRLPKTRSGKILRGIMRKIANGETYKMPATIDDPEILTEITAALQSLNYPPNN